MAEMQFTIGNNELTNLVVQEQVRKEKLQLENLTKRLDELNAEHSDSEVQLVKQVNAEAEKQKKKDLLRAYRLMASLGWLQKAKKLQVRFHFGLTYYEVYPTKTCISVPFTFVNGADESFLPFAHREVFIGMTDELKDLFIKHSELQDQISAVRGEMDALYESINDTRSKEKAVLAALTSEIIQSDPAVQQAVNKILDLTLKNTALPVFEEDSDEG